MRERPKLEFSETKRKHQTPAVEKEINSMKRRILLLLLLILECYQPISGLIKPLETRQRSKISPLQSAAIEPATQAQQSKALEYILNMNEMSSSEFFDNIWQEKPLLLRRAEEIPSGNGGVKGGEPYQEMIAQGWHVLADLLEQAPTHGYPPLVIQNGNIQHPSEWWARYNSSSLFAPYLNGCSVNQAHADCLSPWLAALCEDLERTFPYVYANVYITPPNSRALNLHADDRDVFVLQVLGSKEWEVMKHVPIEYPYPHEQVGKDDLEVPQKVLDQGFSIKTTLNAGDVLYIPRGHCHQARCTDSLSFHVTIAIATFDWTIANIVTGLTKQLLTQVKDYRKGILSMDKSNLQSQLDDAFTLMKKQITDDAVMANLEARVGGQQKLSTPWRIQQMKRSQLMNDQEPLHVSSGLYAAKRVTMDSVLRAGSSALSLEKLQIRSELMASTEQILSELQSKPEMQIKVSDLKSYLQASTKEWCDLAILSLAKRAVELDFLEIVL